MTAIQSLNSAIAKRLANGDHQVESVLAQCACRHEADKSHQLTIECVEDLLPHVQDCLPKICHRMLQLEFENVVVTCNNEIRNQWGIEMLKDLSEQLRPPVPFGALFDLQTNRAICMIRMSDHKTLFCTEALARFDNASSGDWIGLDAEKTLNVPSEFDRFISALLHQQYLDNFEFDTIAVDGAVQKQVVRVWLCHWRKELVRVVEVLSPT